MDKVTPEALTTFLWVGAALCAFALSIWSLVEKVKKSAQWKHGVNEKLSQDKSRIDSLEEGIRTICRSDLAMLSHMINGNSKEKLQEAQSKITDYLIER